MIEELWGWIPSHNLLSLALNVVLGLWLFSVGACVGSFLNVAIYRLPRRMNIAYPPSRCPRCERPIRGYDNIPLISWLALRGRCRTCRAPISLRYPLVECLTAVLFLILAFVEVFSRGANLPFSSAAAANYPWANNLYGNPLSLGDLWGIYTAHVVLFSVLLCSVGIAYDGAVMPLRSVTFVGLILLVVGAVWPAMRPVAMSPPITPLGAPFDWTIGLAEGLLGAAVGGLLGALMFGLRQGKQTNPARAQLAAAELALCGIVLGWQAVTILACFAAIGANGGALVQPKTVGGHRDNAKMLWTLALLIGGVLYIMNWRLLSQRLPHVTVQADWPLLAASLVIVGSMAWALRLLETTETFGAMGMNDQPSPPAEDPAPSAASDQVAQRMQAILQSPSYRLAESDTEFIMRPEMRPIRLQLELLKPETAFLEQDIRSTIVALGGTQIVERSVAQERLAAAEKALGEAPGDPQLQRKMERARRVLAKSNYYDDARQFGRLVSSICQQQGECEYVITTGGGPGVMEAVNRGAFDVGAKSIGLNIVLPEEQAPNSYVTPQLCFQFHYFAVRKMHFLLRAKALIVFPGGFGTLDELFDALTLRQTARMQAIPIILFGKEYWDQVINFQFLADEGVIADEHLDLIDYAETPQQAWEIIAKFHHHQ